jgi:mRNA-degrading endonuclease RelE of RelBE toxin-antitoxin system
LISFESQVTGYRLQVTGYRLQVTGYRLQVTGYRLQVTGYRLQVTGYRLHTMFIQNYFCILILQISQTTNTDTQRIRRDKKRRTI